MSQTKPPNSGLSLLRQEIDVIDSNIVQLLTQRSESIEKIAAIKCQQKLSFHDYERENEIVRKVTWTNPTKYHAIDMANIFQAIFRAGRRQQRLFHAKQKDKPWS